ncbi:AGE family epimerase/isomerase [Robbsia sp. Bb-Pol-6]|uniref:AGE family epimerase/isomerase n=1 Tax=Robbsia betulipollinis TaxID=2981849 RepID=A0ABT3ZM04_9BURK|nr:AGE family epimerase/isomerase [Robbsia betulipollinis]MCY0387566.1 AGE family epimerase/isomerase [Robbsia betulipollinis]
MSNLAHPHHDPALADTIGRLRRHYAEVVVPMWRGPGFDQTLGLPHEAMLGVAPVAASRHRAMACARQLYIFSRLGDQRHADALFASLQRHFHDAEHGGYVYSIDGTGHVLDANKDLYTHAFVIFACAAYLGAFGAQDARQAVSDTARLITERFPTDPANGLPASLVSRDFKTTHSTAQQNPLMHLTEAYLLARQVESDARFDAALDAVLTGIQRVFIDTSSGCVMELPECLDAAWIEPGHQFEWFYLAYHGSYPGFARTGLDRHLLRAFDFAQTHGVDPLTGGVAAVLDRHGRVCEAQQRIWAQTEYLRALACHPAALQREKLPAQAALFETRFVHAQGWHEILAADGAIRRADMPSTTPYHLLGSYEALP